MKKLLTILVVLSWTLSLTAQIVPSPFRGQWFGVATPVGIAANTYSRTLMGISVAEDGTVQGTRFYYDSEEFDNFTGTLTSTGKLIVVTEEGESLTLRFTRKGRGTGLNKFTSATYPDVTLRETITLYRENVKQSL